ncbi:MAG TPA: HAD hydrolase-like protein, partial [Lysobacter sp.]|nr:HAD hydrolase-like protein [Lysobacter sp.]
MTAVAGARAFPRVALFDLDGTLLDSAPDMLATVDAMRAARGRGPMAMEVLRPVVSKGARAMTAAAFPDVPAEERNLWIPEFLEIYERELGKH